MLLFRFCFVVIGCAAAVYSVGAAELPLVRIAHGAFSEKVALMWVGTEQGLFRKHGVHVEVINIRSGPQTMAALASGDIQIAYTIPGSVVSAATGGFDAAFFAGIVNKADGDFIAAPQIRAAEDLKGKRVGVQSIGGGVWSMAMLAIEHLGLEPGRDKLTIMIIGTLGGAGKVEGHAGIVTPTSCSWVHPERASRCWPAGSPRSCRR